jgi:hypothetical protein
VCGAECRAARDRKLARRRRQREVEDARADERERQRARRAKRSTASGCHAPSSAPKPPISRGEIADFVDRAFALSRAKLVRDLRAGLGRYAQKPGEPMVGVTHEAARGTLGNGDGFRANAGERHA